MLRIAYVGLHFGEEPPLTGEKGAGGIFFSGCELNCVYCQNHQISQGGLGRNYTTEEVVQFMLDLQTVGATCIDLVSPSAWTAPLLEVIPEARKQGLRIPIVWNSHGYEKVETLKKLEGLVDVYLVDYKYGLPEVGEKYSGVKDYPEVADAAVREMWRQVGELTFDAEGHARRGMIVRHLILPNNLGNTRAALRHLAKVAPEAHLSLMCQYYPCHRAGEYPELARPLTQAEWAAMTAYVQELGFSRGWTQELSSSEVFLPDFTQEHPFGA